LPDPSLSAVIARVRMRWRVRSIALMAAVAGAVFAAAIVLSSLSVAAMAAAIAGVVMFVRATPMSGVDAARLIESRFGALDNLVVTAAELDERPRPIRPEIRDEITRQAAERILNVDANRVVPLSQPIAVAAAVLIGCAVLGSIGTTSLKSRVAAVSSDRTESETSATLTVRVTPPSYTKRRIEVFENPLQVSVIAGSRIQIEAAGSTLRNWIATESTAIEQNRDSFPSSSCRMPLRCCGW